MDKRTENSALTVRVKVNYQEGLLREGQEKNAIPSSARRFVGRGLISPARILRIKTGGIGMPRAGRKIWVEPADKPGSV